MLEHMTLDDAHDSLKAIADLIVGLVQWSRRADEILSDAYHQLDDETREEIDDLGTLRDNFPEICK